MAGKTTWQLDPAHTTIEFAVKHMMFTTVRGRFKEFTGTVLVDEQNPGVLVGHAVKIEIEAQAVKEDGSPLAPDG